MKKVKRINLNQSHLLSYDDMAKVYGGEYLHESCHAGNLGLTCVTTYNGHKYSGKCKYESSYSTDGTSSSSSSHYYCDPEF